MGSLGRKYHKRLVNFPYLLLSFLCQDFRVAVAGHVLSICIYRSLAFVSKLNGLL